VGVGVAPVTVDLLTALPAPLVFSSAIPTPATVAAVVVVGAVAVQVGVAPAMLAVVVALPVPERVGPPPGLNINPPGPVEIGAITSRAVLLPGDVSERSILLPGGIG
jgi:hypothetical protein